MSLTCLFLPIFLEEIVSAFKTLARNLVPLEAVCLGPSFFPRGQTPEIPHHRRLAYLLPALCDTDTRRSFTYSCPPRLVAISFAPISSLQTEISLLSRHPQQWRRRTATQVSPTDSPVSQNNHHQRQHARTMCTAHRTKSLTRRPRSRSWPRACASGRGRLDRREGSRDHWLCRARAGHRIAPPVHPHARATQDDKARGLAEVRYRQVRILTPPLRGYTHRQQERYKKADPDRYPTEASPSQTTCTACRS